MGISGAALSTTIARFIAGLMIVGALYGGRTQIKLTLTESYLPDPAVKKKIIRIGFPTAMERFVLSMGQVFMTRIVASLGTVQLAAHHIAIVAEAISYMPGFGFSIAATTLVGQMLGAKRPDKAEKYAYETLRISVVVMTVMGMILFLFPRQLMQIFTDDPDVIRYGAVCLRIVAFSQPFFASGMVQAGALRGAGDTKWPLYITMISMWGIRLSIAWFLVYIMDMGLTGAWLALTLDLTVRGILMFIRFRKGEWKRIDL
jgi:putative MATE family efflux protein